MRHANAVVRALAAATCFAGSLASAAEPKFDEANAPLKAVSKRERFVFASTSAGLFRAPIETERWERLKTPPEMPPNGTFAGLPERSPLIIYVAMRSTSGVRRPGARYGLYLSRDDGANWELASERDDFGAALLLPDGALFAITGADEFNGGDHLLRSPDLGKTWRDVSGNLGAQLTYLEPDPDHPGLVRIHGWDLRGSLMLVADDESYRWKHLRHEIPTVGCLPGDEFFTRWSSGANRFHLYHATLANYFRYDFGNQVRVQAFEVVPRKEHFEFAKGNRVAIPVRVVFRYDPYAALAHWLKSRAEGHPYPKPTPPTEKIADQPGGTDFWGVRVESAKRQFEKYPEPDFEVLSRTVEKTGNGWTTRTTKRMATDNCKGFDLSPSGPYEREIDLSRLADFSRPGEYRVQILYRTVRSPEGECDVWNGSFTSPVFTVRIRE
jgi:hypothetical protein